MIRSPQTELFYSGQWNNITANGFTRNTDPIEIVRALPDELQEAPPASLGMTLNNRDGRFTIDKPDSPLFGLIGRNTPIRVYLGTKYSGEFNFDFVDTTSHVAPSVSAPTDDGLLMCFWAANDPDDTYTLPGGMTGGGSTNDGRTTLDSAHEVISTEGATGTRTAEFSASAEYMALSVIIPGSSPTVISSTGVSVLHGMNQFSVGTTWIVASYFAWDSTAVRQDMPYAPYDTDHGGWILLADTGIQDAGGTLNRWRRMQVWAKRVKTLDNHIIRIDNPSGAATIQSVVSAVGGTTSWDIRFTGEVDEWPTEFNLDGTDIWVPLDAADITRRIGRVNRPLGHTVERFVSQYRNVAIGYWQLDDPELSTKLKSSIDGNSLRGPGGSLFDLPIFGQGTTAPWLPSAIQTSGSIGTVNVNLPNSVGGGWVVDFMYRAPSPGTWGDDWPQQVNILVRDDGDGEDGVTWLVTFIPADEPLDSGDTENVIELFITQSGSPPAATSVTFPSTLANGQPHHIRVRALEQSGNGGALFVDVDGVNIAQLLNSDIGTADIQPPTELHLDWITLQRSGGGTIATLPVALNQLTMWQEPVPGLVDSVNAYFGHQQEKPSERFKRVCFEESIPHVIIGEPIGAQLEHVRLGPQFPGKIMEVLRETAATGGGWLYTPREFRGLAYRTLPSAYDQIAVHSHPFSTSGIRQIQPITDNQRTANDVTAERRLGGVARSIQQVGPLNINDPTEDPEGVGVYDINIEPRPNVSADGPPLLNQASWRRNRGTVKGRRYPEIQFDLDNASGQLVESSIAALDVADRFAVESPPAYLPPPEDISQLSIGFIEEIRTERRLITVNGTPESPFHIAQVGAASGGGLALFGTSGDYASTPDDVSFDITNGFSVAILVVRSDRWQLPGGDETGISQYQTSGDQRSFRLSFDADGGGNPDLAGRPFLVWSEDGTSTPPAFKTAFATNTLPETDDNVIAVQATLVLDNGSGVWEVTFEWATTLDGPWTQLGQVVNGSGTTSVHNSTGELTIGAYSGGAAENFRGRVLAAELRDDQGAALATPDFTAENVGTESFNDATGNTWTINGDAVIVGEVVDNQLNLVRSNTTTLNATLDTTQSDVAIHLGAGANWTHIIDFTILLGGEAMTVVAISAASGTFPNRTQTLTVARSTNGVVKEHTQVGVPVRFLQDAYVGL